MRWGLIAGLLFLSSTLFAGSLRLINDSPFVLRAVVRGADGSYLGEMILKPQHSNNWSDGLGVSGSYNQSQTPYNVTWYCMEGAVFSFCGVASSGSSVAAQSCDGARSCQPSKQGAPQPHSSQPEQQLQDFGPPSEGVGPPAGGVPGS
jgi:hypothetical protein